MSHPRSRDMLPPISSDMLRPAYQHLQSVERSWESGGAAAGSTEFRGSRVRPTLGQSCSPGSGGDDGGGCRERRRPGRFPEPEQRWRWWTGTNNPPYRSVSRCSGAGLWQHACTHEPLCDLGDRPIIPKLRSEVTLTLLCQRKNTTKHNVYKLPYRLLNVGQTTPWFTVTLDKRDELPHISKQCWVAYQQANQQTG